MLVALIVFLMLRGFLESGLFDATTSFIVLCTLAFSSVLLRGHTTLDEDEPTVPLPRPSVFRLPEPSRG